MTSKEETYIHLLNVYLSANRLSDSQLSELEMALNDPLFRQLLENKMDRDLATTSKRNNVLGENRVPDDLITQKKDALDKLLKSLELKESLANIVNSSLDSAHYRESSVTPIGRKYKWGWIAAIFLIGIGLGGIKIYQQATKNQIERNTALLATELKGNKLILPGSTGAVLTLADGKKVALGGHQRGIIHVGSTTIQLDKEIVKFLDNGSHSINVAYNEISTSRGKQYQLQLADGTKVWLNAASRLRFPTVFNRENRTVELSGEAYFEVVHDAHHPFQVRVKSQLVEDMGTHFNVKAYPDEKAATTTLLEGAVKVYAGSNKTLLIPGQQARVFSGKIAVKQVDVNQVVAWKSGFFAFNNASVGDIMRQLSRWYDVDIEYQDDLSEDARNAQRFSGKVDRSLPLTDLLAGLKFARMHFKIDENNRKIIIQN